MIVFVPFGKGLTTTVWLWGSYS